MPNRRKRDPLSWARLEWDTFVVTPVVDRVLGVQWFLTFLVSRTALDLKIGFRTESENVILI